MFAIQQNVFALDDKHTALKLIQTFEHDNDKTPFTNSKMAYRNFIRIVNTHQQFGK